jgi:hypothetical protein
VGLFKRRKVESDNSALKSEIPQVSVEISVSQPDPAAAYEYTPPKDNRAAVCPNCSAQLKKVPGSKTKCPFCSKFMFVRTEPHTRTRVIVTEAGAEEIDDEIAKLNGTWEDRLREKQRLAKTKADLKKKFGGQEPSKDDIEWSIAIQDSMTYAKERWWSSYALNQAKKASLLEKRGKSQNAFELLLEVAYLEHNGAQESNADAPTRKMMAEMGFKEFDPTIANLPPYTLSDIQRLIVELGLNLDTVEAMFLAQAQKLKIGKLPISPTQSWEYLKSLL